MTNKQKNSEQKKGGKTTDELDAINQAERLHADEAEAALNEFRDTRPSWGGEQ